MSRGTIHRTIRIGDDIWLPAKAKADRRGEHLSDVIRDALKLYAEDQHPKMSDPYTATGAAHIATCPRCQVTFG
jgi:hypothetical protein